MEESNDPTFADVEKAKAKLATRLRNRRNKIQGINAELILGMALRRLGLEMVEPIETGWKLTWRNGRVIDARAKRKVHGDLTAIVPGTGQSVRCEVKKTQDDQLSLSDFEPHQLDALTLHASLGGLSLVGWRTSLGTEVLRWPISGLAKGHPLNVGDPRTLGARWHGVRPVTPPATGESAPTP